MSESLNSRQFSSSFGSGISREKVCLHASSSAMLYFVRRSMTLFISFILDEYVSYQSTFDKGGIIYLAIIKRK